MKPAEVLAIAFEEQARARAIVAGLGECSIRVSRSTTELGSILVDRHGGPVEIRVSRHLRDEDQVRETARHELAHQAAWERYRDLGHGALWQTLAAYLGCEPVPCSVEGIDPEVMRKRQRYIVTCAVCGWGVTRQKRSKLIDKPWRFSCAHCGGKLTVAMNAASQ
jgi:predicted SprT family Zn-dependent metalloprotease